MQDGAPLDLRATAALGAGEPGALEALFAARAAAAARRALQDAFRRDGWRAARVDPLGLEAPEEVPELDALHWGLPPEDAAQLCAAYCGAIGWEIGHVEPRGARDWLAARAEADFAPSAGAVAAAHDLVARAEALEAAFRRRLPGVKIFGLAGSEGYVVLIEAVLATAVCTGVDEVVIGGHHRGRVTQMVLNFGKPLVEAVAEASGAPPVPAGLGVLSDVPYHLGHAGEREIAGRPLGIWVAPHPSHLSLVGPFAQGRARARAAARAGEGGAARVLPLLLHTDAAFAGQGINMEVMQLAGLAPYEVGGTVHLLLDNRIGFTTPPDEARTARSAADIARLTGAPILHVNGEDPAAILRAAQTAVDFRATFGRDIVVRLVAFRRLGHNELDEPRFTQPREYRLIDALPPLSERLAAQLGRAPDIGEFIAGLDAAFRAARDWAPPAIARPPGLAADIEARLLEPVATGVEAARLRALGRRITRAPEGFRLHPKVAQFLERRARAVEAGEGIDWATAEALALASLLEDGFAIRFSGQDSVRGAFSQRHLALFDQESGAGHMVLDGLGGRAEVFNTPLTENAVLAFEFGHATAASGMLTLWEAQFGDFLNVAQAVFDQVLAGAETRWLVAGNLVILLPHGIEGGGPDHATARPERLLAAAAQGNFRLVSASTPANWFHALRRQMHAGPVKPLIALTPKLLLRHPACVSSLAEMGAGTGFRAVIPDHGVRGARRVVLTTGKLFHLLDAARREAGHDDIALIRVEQLYPLDAAALAAALADHPRAELVWAEEEPANMGFHATLAQRLAEIAGRTVGRVGRPAMASPSEGPKKWEEAALAEIIERALGARPGRAARRAPKGGRKAHARE